MPPRGPCWILRAPPCCDWPSQSTSRGTRSRSTGEGADEALAGYVWYKTQKVRDAIERQIGPAATRFARKLVMGSIAGRDVASRSRAGLRWRAARPA